MKHIGVTQKLWLGVASIVLGAILIVGHAGYNSAAHQRRFNQQDSLLSQRLDQASQWSALSQVNIVRTQAALLSSEAQDAADLGAHIAATHQAIDGLQQALQASSLDRQDQAALQQLAQLRQALQAAGDQARQLQASGQLEAARQATRSSYRQAADAYAQALAAYVHQQAQRLAEMRADMGAARQGVVKAAALNMAFLLLGVAVGAYLLIGSIRRALRAANQVAEQIAAGDLRTRFDQPRHDEFGQLLQSLERMSHSLSAMIDDVRDSGDAITVASGEIASGNQDLSQRTEVTASHLQQAAAAMMQLTQTLQATAASAQQAAGLAHQASGVAQRGGAVVSEVVTTMTDIHSRSQQIADIIGVIDGIAFQTNILALNAAVEAARAGEQGRGFAVVASEVRALSQRTTAAAKDISTLIARSAERVTAGVQQAGATGSTMDSIEATIHRVTALVQDIAQASQAQSTGVLQMGGALSDIDNSTQHNAALVEEMAAAASSLHSQSQGLLRSASAFQTDTGTPRPVGPALQA